MITKQKIVSYAIAITLLSMIGAQSLVNRFKVPLYLSTSISIGYDSNIFRLSDFEKTRIFSGTALEWLGLDENRFNR